MPVPCRRSQPVVLHINGAPDQHILFQCAADVCEVHFRVHVLDRQVTAQSYLSGQGVFADRSAFPLPRLMVLNFTAKAKQGLSFLEWLRSPQNCCLVPVIILVQSREMVSACYAAGANAVFFHTDNYLNLKKLLRALDEALAQPAFFPGLFNSLPFFCPPESESVSGLSEGEAR